MIDRSAIAYIILPNILRKFVPTDDRNSALKAKFEMMRACYQSCHGHYRKLFDVQLLSKLIVQMENGKAAGLHDLSCEHLKYSLLSPGCYYNSV